MQMKASSTRKNATLLKTDPALIYCIPKIIGEEKLTYYSMLPILLLFVTLLCLLLPIVHLPTLLRFQINRLL